MLVQLNLKLQPRLLVPLLSNHDLTWMQIFSWLRFYLNFRFFFQFFKALNLLEYIIYMIYYYAALGIIPDSGKKERWASNRSLKIYPDGKIHTTDTKQNMQT